MSAITFLAFIIYDWRGRYPRPLSLSLSLAARAAATTTAARRVLRDSFSAAAAAAAVAAVAVFVVRGHFMIGGMGMLPAEWRAVRGYYDGRNDHLCTWRFARGEREVPVERVPHSQNGYGMNSSWLRQGMSLGRSRVVNKGNDSMKFTCLYL